MPDWQALVASHKGIWEAIWPINLDRKWGLAYSLGPYYTPHLGVLYIALLFDRHLKNRGRS